MNKHILLFFTFIGLSGVSLATFKQKPVCHYGGHTYEVNSKPSNDTICLQVGKRFEVVIDASAQSHLYDDVERNSNVKVIEENDGTAVEVDFDLVRDKVSN